MVNIGKTLADSKSELRKINKRNIKVVYSTYACS